jgi:hypothetical protein
MSYTRNKIFWCAFYNYNPVVWWPSCRGLQVILESNGLFIWNWNKTHTLDSRWRWWHFVAQYPQTSISVFAVAMTQASVISGCTRISCISVTPGPEPPRRLLLQYLDLTDCHAVEDGGLRVIVRNCPQLAYLYLRRCVQITGEACGHSTSDSDTRDWTKYMGNIFLYGTWSILVYSLNNRIKYQLIIVIALRVSEYCHHQEHRITHKKAVSFKPNYSIHNTVFIQILPIKISKKSS